MSGTKMCHTHSTRKSLRAAAVLVLLVLNILAVWIMWEAVVKPLKSCCPSAWSRDFPASFYLWSMPVWVWHDLAITVVIVCSVILAYLVLVCCERCEVC